MEMRRQRRVDAAVAVGLTLGGSMSHILGHYGVEALLHADPPQPTARSRP
jgi:hypothetical protein